MHFSKVFGALASVSIALAQNVTHCVSGGICFAVNIPETSASSGNGDIYIQISGPSSMSWIGIGQASGSSMRGSNIFMIYSNAAGDNVTLSPRLGVSNDNPTFGSTADVTLLEGSGISNGVMVANFRCSNCDSWSGGSMGFTDSSSKWIWGSLGGGGVSSDSLTTSLSQHSDYGSFRLDLQSAAGGNDTNPFLGVTATTTTQSQSGSGSSSSDDDSESSGDSGHSLNYSTIVTLHGILAGVAWVIMFPLGGMAMRLLNFRGLVWMHAGWMILTYMIVLASMGLAVWMSVDHELLDSNHAVIGLVAAGCLLIQPITGVIHHKIFKHKGRLSLFTYAHLWWGRSVITLGIINGGLGLQLSGKAENKLIIYGVVAGVIWVLWMGVNVFAFMKNKRRHGRITENGSKERMTALESL